MPKLCHHIRVPKILSPYMCGKTVSLYMGAKTVFCLGRVPKLYILFMGRGVDFIKNLEFVMGAKNVSPYMGAKTVSSYMGAKTVSLKWVPKLCQ